MLNLACRDDGLQEEIIGRMKEVFESVFIVNVEGDTNSVIVGLAADHVKIRTNEDLIDRYNRLNLREINESTYELGLEMMRTVYFPPLSRAEKQKLRKKKNKKKKAARKQQKSTAKQKNKKR